MGPRIMVKDIPGHWPEYIGKLILHKRIYVCKRETLGGQFREVLLSKPQESNSDERKDDIDDEMLLH